MTLKLFYQSMQDVFNKLTLSPIQTFEALSKLWEPNHWFFDLIYDHSENWYSTDNEKNFIKNGNKQYTENCITYDFSKSNFRMQKNETMLNNKPIIACFGCSNTFGFGLKYEDTWPMRLSGLLNQQFAVYNYGVGGCSFDHISRLIHNYLLIKTPKIICCLLPDIFRREMFDSTTTTKPRHMFNMFSPCEQDNISLEERCKWFKFNIEDWKAYRRVSGEDNSILNFYRNLKFVEALSEAKNIPVIFMTWDKYLLSCLKQSPSMSAFQNFVTPSHQNFEYLMNEPQNEKARDGEHLGKKAAKIIAEMYYNKIINSL